MKNRRLRVTFLNRSFAPDPTSTGQLLAELACALTAEADVTVIAGHVTETSEDFRPSFREIVGMFWPQKSTWNGVTVYRCGLKSFSKKNLLGRSAAYVGYFLSAWIGMLRARRPDVVVAWTDPPIIGLVGLFCKTIRFSRFAVIVQDVFPEVALLLNGFQQGRLYKFLDRTGKKILGGADRVIVIGEAMRDAIVELKKVAPEKISVIHNWEDTTKRFPTPKKNNFSIQKDLADQFVVMHAGNMGLSQDLDVFLGAAQLLQSKSDIKFVFLGDGVRKGELVQKSAEMGLKNLYFLPHISKEQLNEPYGAADVFVVSLKEGLAGKIVPSKIYGILASGRPYVAAVEEKSEITAITQKYESGLLARVGNSQDMAEKILRLHASPEICLQYGENARKASLQFDLRVQAEAYYEIFRRLVDGTLKGSPRPPSLLKRPFDVFLSGVGLLLSSPFWALFAALIKLEDGGPVFYPQDRVGKNGELFKIWKFRSMIPDAEKDLGAVQSTENDPRITRIGRLLRATAMDELPQLYNIFRGDMSFVGPRAIRPGEKEVHGDGSIKEIMEIPGGKERLVIKPGLTGIAQIFGKHDTPRLHKFRYDIFYVQRQSFCLDLKLIVMSFWITLRGKWESRDKKI